MKKVLVQKFGGTSVGIPDRLRSLCEIVKGSTEEYCPIVVVSAVSGSSKASGSTSLLLAAVNAASQQKDYEPMIDQIYVQHRDLINEVLPDKGNDLIEVVQKELDVLKDFLKAIAVIGEASQRSIDVVASRGEVMSALLVTAVLRSKGIEAHVCDFSRVLIEELLVGDEEGSLQQRLTGRLYDDLASVFARSLGDFENSVPVVTGFFGPFPGGLLERVGRGYSDLTAALVARGLGGERVKELQVWKEVDGVFSADPRRVPGAKVLSEISAVEAVELTFFGSEVLHPYTMEQVTSVGIPIRVLNSLKPAGVGTIILPKSSHQSSSPSAVTGKRGAVILNVSSNRMYDAKGFLATLFGLLNEYDLVVDLVSTSEVTVSCTVNDAQKLRRALPKLELLGNIEISEGRAILAVVGEGLKGQSGTLGVIFESLGKAGIPTEMITQASSQTSVSCVVLEGDLERALLVVHEALFEVS